MVRSFKPYNLKNLIMTHSNSISFFIKISLLFGILLTSFYNSNASIYEYNLPEGEISGSELKAHFVINKVNQDTIKLIIDDGVDVTVSPAGSDWDLTDEVVVIIEILGSDNYNRGGGSLIIPKKSSVLLSDNSSIVMDSTNSDGLIGAHDIKSHLNIGLAIFHGSVFEIITKSGGAHSGGFGNRIPVELYSFNTKKNKKGEVVIQWTTVNEENSHHFEIQKSNDGLTFYTLAEVSSAGDSKYSFEDKDLTSSSSVYYRLTHVNYEGKFTALDIKRID